MRAEHCESSIPWESSIASQRSESRTLKAEQRAAPSVSQPSACRVGAARRRCLETPHQPRSSRRHAVHPRSGSRAALCQEVVAFRLPQLSLSARLDTMDEAFCFEKQRREQRVLRKARSKLNAKPLACAQFRRVMNSFTFHAEGRPGWSV